jgi:hypothetical protein
MTSSKCAAKLTNWRGRLSGLAYEVRRVQDEEKHEREKLALRLENELLKFERRLPAGKTTEE